MFNETRKQRIKVTIDEHGVEYWYDHGELYAIKCRYGRVRNLGARMLQAHKRRVAAEMRAKGK